MKFMHTLTWVDLLAEDKISKIRSDFFFKKETFCYVQIVVEPVF